ncbi:hypothetical protein HDU86_000536 [Geranomyces michiganensis]|nr:hypothetical protein HDU86_000536 [Geranomyces michiganensis]
MSAQTPVAIVGIGCRFPNGCDDKNMYFDFLQSKGDAMKPTPSDRWDRSEWEGSTTNPGKINANKAGWVNDTDLFDPLEFGMSNKEAQWADPSLLMLLEVAHQALRDSGTDYRGTSTGVYVGQLLTSMSEVDTNRFDIESSAGTGKCIAIRANRISYNFDLRGPSLVCDTACSSSGTAMCLALNAITAGHIDQALVLGASTIANPMNSVAFSKLGVLSSTGSSKSFSTDADGYARAEGFGCVFIKRLDAAVKDNDQIYSVITGGFINANGRGKALTMPEGVMQAEAITRAYEIAGRQPSDACFAELHATGTVVGDPIEVNAAGAIFAEGRPQEKTLRIGSVKANMGHMEGSSFLASLIKVSMMFHHKLLIPNIRLNKPNAKIQFEKHNMRVQTELEPLEPCMAAADGKWVASVSSYGVGGSNSHLVLETYETADQVVAAQRQKKTDEEAKAASPDLKLFNIGTFTERSLKKLGSVLQEHYEHTTDDLTLRSLARQLSRQSRACSNRTFAVARSISDAKFNPPTLVKPGKKTLCLVFSGQGPQHIFMGRQLSAAYPQFLASIMESDRILQETYGCEGFVAKSGLFVPGRESTLAANGQWEVSAVVYSLVFFQIAMVELLQSLGVSFDCVVGHSIGEVAMGFASGAMTKSAAIGIAVARAFAMSNAAGNGSMVAVSIGDAQARTYIKTVLKKACQTSGLWIAGINSPTAVTIAGREDLVDAMVLHAKSKDVFAAKLRVTCAFHSPLMDKEEGEFKRLAAAAYKAGPLKEVTAKVMSTVEGGWLSREMTADYCWDNIRQPVLFKAAIENIVKERGAENVAFLEIAPHPVLKAYIEQCGGHAISLVKRPNPKFPAQNTGEHFQFLEGIGALTAFGYNGINFDAFYCPEGQDAATAFLEIDMPEYPYTKQRCWMEDPQKQSERLTKAKKPLEGPHIRLNEATHPSLVGHAIMGTVLLPASGYVEAILEHGAMVVENMSVSKPLVMLAADAFPAHVGTVINGDKFAICSSTNSTFDKGHIVMDTTYAAGTFALSNPAMEIELMRPADLLVSNILTNSCGSIKGDAFYNCIPAGYNYSELFRTLLDEVYEINDPTSFGGKAYLSRCIVPEGAFDASEPGYVIHPGLLDSITQMGLALYIDMEKQTFDADVLFLPTKIDNFTRWEGQSGEPMNLGDEIYTYFKVTRYAPEGPVSGDYIVSNKEGKVIFTITGFTISLVPSGVPTSINDENKNERLTTLWQPQALLESAATIADSAAYLSELMRAILEAAAANGRCTVSILDLTVSDEALTEVEPVMESLLEEKDLVVEYFLSGTDKAEIDARNAKSPYPHTRSVLIDDSLSEKKFDVVIGCATGEDLVLNLVKPGGCFLQFNEENLSTTCTRRPNVDYSALETTASADVHVYHVEHGNEGDLVNLAKTLDALESELWILGNHDAAGIAALGIAMCIAEESHSFKVNSLLFEDLALNTAAREEWVHRLRAGNHEEHSKVTVDGRILVRRLARTAQHKRAIQDSHVALRVTSNKQFAVNVSRPDEVGPEQIAVQTEALAFVGATAAAAAAAEAEEAARISFVGTVAEAHSSVKDLAGKRVIGLALHRPADVVVANADQVISLPDSVSASEAAALAHTFTPALLALSGASASARRQQSVLVLNAATDLGMATVQLAQRCGLDVSCTVRSESELAATSAALGLEDKNIFLALDSEADLINLATKNPAIQNRDLVVNAGQALNVRFPEQLVRASGKVVQFASRSAAAPAATLARGTLELLDADLLLKDCPERLTATMNDCLEMHARKPFEIRATHIAFSDLAERLNEKAVDMVGKLIVVETPAAATAAMQSVQVDPELQLFNPRKSYLLVGGCSELGVRIVDWMVKRGARHVLMSSRRGMKALSKVDKLYIQHMLDLGATIDVIAADALNHADTERLFAAATDRGPIGGIFHMTVILRDGLFTNLDQSSFDDVYRSKVDALNMLLQFVKPADLEFMLLFSTIGSVFGNAGQSAYCAAQLYLDRIADEMPNTISMSFPPIIDSGIFKRLIAATKGKATAHLTRMGMSTAQVCNFIGDSLIRNIAHYVPLMPGAIEHVCDTFRGCEPLLYSHLRTKQLIESGDDNDSGAGVATPEGIIAPMLGLDPVDLIENAPLSSFGLDSLGASKLSHDLKAKLGINVSQMQLLGTVSVGDLKKMCADLAANAALGVATVDLNQDPLEAKFGKRISARVDDILKDTETYTTEASMHQQRIWAAQNVMEEAKKTAGTVRIDPKLAKFAATQWDTHEGYYIEMETETEPDLPSMEQAFHQIIERHGALRTTFAWSEEEGKLMQTVHKGSHFGWDFMDLTEYGCPTTQAYLEAVAANEDPDFHLDRLPLIRLKLFKLGTNSYSMCVIAHHILVDFTSIGLLFNEWISLQQGGIDALAPVKVQYSDFADWQRDESIADRRAQIYEEQLEFWATRLENVAPLTLSLSNTAFSSPAAKTQIDLPVDAELMRKFEASCQSAGATTFTGYLSAFALLLQMYSQTESPFVIGTPITERDSPDLQSTFGFFSNLISVPVDLTDSSVSFSEFLASFKNNVLECMANKDVPYEEVVARSNSSTEARGFRHLFTLETMSLPKESVNGTSFKSISTIPNSEERYDALLTCHPEDHCLVLRFNRYLFTESIAEQFLKSYIDILRNVVEDVSATVAEVSAVRDEKYLSVIRSKEEVAEPVCVHTLFEAQVLKTPYEPALIFENNVMPYQELNERANRLARHLGTLGAGVGSKVGVCLDRGFQQIISLLAVVKSGSAFVTLDPDSPVTRHQGMLEDCESKIVITSKDYAKDFAAIEGLSIVIIDQEKTQLLLKSYAESNVEVAGLQPSDLAYVMFTSGSTGKPKGVQIEHKSISNITRNAHLYGFQAGKRVLSSLTMTFDPFCVDLFGSLCNGATLCLGAKELVLGDIAEAVNALRINVLHLTPSILATVTPQDFATLETVVVAGEPLGRKLIADWCDRVSLRNFYGPTEVTVDCLTLETKTTAETGLIGRPLPGCSIYILDRNGAVVPLGVEGELHVGGIQVSRGYIGRPDLTEASFVSMPHITSERLYKTGDMCRMGEDGRVEYIGRRDFQVKIRGQRIELNEINEAILDFPGVARSAVLLKKEEDEPEIVAYVEFEQEVLDRNGLDDEVEGLKHALYVCLPRFMNPSVFVTLPRLPSTSSGKVDRRQLQTIDITPFRTAVDNTIVPPQNDIEEKLLTICAGYLGTNVEELGVTQDLFLMGINSMEAVRLAESASKEFNMRLTLNHIYLAPTVRELGRFILETIGQEEHQLSSMDEDAEKSIELLPIKKNGVEPRLFFIHDVTGMATFFMRLGPYLNNEMYAIGDKHLGSPEGFASIDEMAAHYITLVQEVQPKGPYYLVGYSFGGPVAVEMANLLIEKGEIVQHVLLLDPAYMPPSQRQGLRLTSYVDDSTERIASHFSELSANWRQRLTIEIRKLLVLYIKHEPRALPDLPVTLIVPRNRMWFRDGPGKDIGDKTRSEHANGWDIIMPQIEVVESAGRHDTLFAPAHVRQLSNVIRNVVRRAQAQKTAETAARDSPESPAR